MERQKQYLNVKKVERKRTSVLEDGGKDKDEGEKVEIKRVKREQGVIFVN